MTVFAGTWELFNRIPFISSSVSLETWKVASYLKPDFSPEYFFSMVSIDFLSKFPIFPAYTINLLATETLSNKQSNIAQCNLWNRLTLSEFVSPFR